MFTLQTIDPTFGLRNASCFSLKVMTLLEMGGYAYERVSARPDRAPKGKLPVLIDGDRVVPDSTHIQAYLETHHGATWDAGLGPEALAEAQAYRTMVEEHLYFAVGYTRWDVHAEQFRDGAFEAIPKLIRSLVFRGIRKGVLASLRGQGMGRHTEEEVYAFGVADLRALEARLQGGPFFFGHAPTSIDASIYGMLHGLCRGPFPDPISEFARQSSVLMAYEARMDARVFGEASGTLAAAQ